MLSLEVLPLASRVLSAFKSVLLYLWKMALPLHLDPLYLYSRDIRFLSFEYLSAVALVAWITFLCIRAAINNRKLWTALWGYYIVTLLPVLGIVQVGSQSMADRFTYIPGLGFSFLAGLGGAWLWNKAETFKGRVRVFHNAMLAGALLLLIGMSHMTVLQIRVWNNDIGFWDRVIGTTPYPFPPAYNNRGISLHSAGRFGEALADFDTAIALDPGYAKTYTSRGWTYLALGKFDRAIQDFDRSIQLDPAFYLAYADRGIALGESGRFEEAVDDFTTAIILKPDFAGSYTGRGFAQIQIGHPEEAAEDLNKAISLNPSMVDAYLNRGVAFERMNQFGRAIKDYNKALELDPSDYLVYSNRGIAFGKMGRVAEAVEDQSKALFLKPDFTQAYIDRGDLYLKMSSTALAMTDYRTACDLGSEDGCKALRTHGRK